jgi:hypothetical protein
MRGNLTESALRKSIIIEWMKINLSWQLYYTL